MPLYLEIFSPQGPINDLVDMFRPLAEKHQVTLIDRVNNKDDFFLYADKTRFKQALLNLISNGIKYNKPGGTVTVEIQTLSEDLARINVSDTGRGIENSKLKQTFEAFHREELRDISIEGAGIGLTITQQLIELMNGKITVESTLDKGSCFTIDLPQNKPTQNIQTPEAGNSKD